MQRVNKRYYSGVVTYHFTGKGPSSRFRKRLLRDRPRPLNPKGKYLIVTVAIATGFRL